MTVERVRMWRPGDDAGVLLMAGETDAYAVEPRGEFVFGIVTRGGLRAHSRGRTHDVAAGDVVAWDPSAPHAGRGRDGRPWTSRLVVVEVADLTALASDEESPMPAELRFPEPVVRARGLATAFARMHRALEGPTARLERDELLAGWLGAVVGLAAVKRPDPAPRTPHDERAFRLACDFLGDRVTDTVGLDELAAAAGIGKFRLVRLFRARTGLPPHALLVAHRVRRARRLLERGATVGEAAAGSGFSDQSHLHRHFRRTLGMTPATYRRRVAETSAARRDGMAAGNPQAR